MSTAFAAYGGFTLELSQTQNTRATDPSGMDKQIATEPAGVGAGAAGAAGVEAADADGAANV
jgi:hypothetical protein